MYGFRVGEKVMIWCKYNNALIGPFTISSFDGPIETDPYVNFVENGWQTVKELRKIGPYQMEFSFMKDV